MSKKVSVILTAVFLVVAILPAMGISAMVMPASVTSERPVDLGAKANETRARASAAMVLAQSEVTYADSKLKTFATAFVEANAIRKEFEARIEAASTKEEADRLREKMEVAGTVALKRSGGIDLREFMETMKASNTDPNLRKRLQPLLTQALSLRAARETVGKFAQKAEENGRGKASAELAPALRSGGSNMQLSEEFRKSYMRIMIQVALAEKTKDICDRKFPETTAANGKELVKWEGTNRIPGAKAFLSKELGHIDPNYKRLLEDEISQASAKIEQRSSAGGLTNLCSEFPENYKYITGPKQRYLLSMHKDFYTEAAHAFPQYFTECASDKWARTDPVAAIDSDPLPEGVSDWCGESVGIGQAVYVNRPQTNYDVIGGSMSMSYGVRVVDADVAKAKGPIIDGWYYVARPPDGFTFKGVFTSYGGITMSVGVGGVIGNSSANVFRFTEDGRFSMAENAAAIVSTQGQVGGSYYVAGYSIELRPDGGKPVRLSFIPYTAGAFAPNDKASNVRDRIIYLNLDRKLYLRDSDYD